MNHSQKALSAIFIMTAVAGCGTETYNGQQDSSAIIVTSPNTGETPQSDANNEPPAKDFDSPDTDREHFYFSYDDSASTAGMEVVQYYLQNDLVPPLGFVKAYEFLNFETFDVPDQTQGETFSVALRGWERTPITDDLEALKQLEFGAYLASPVQTKESRMNLVLTLLVDVSGSMGSRSAELGIETTNDSRLSIVKQALRTLEPFSLKAGDVVNLVRFSFNSDSEDVLLQNWEFGVDDPDSLDKAISRLNADGGTGLDAGLSRAYKVATETYDTNKLNRVIILTDAEANVGEVDATIVAEKTEINNAEGIYFSGIGVGTGFNHAFLDELTEAGKGAYMTMVTPSDAVRIFDDRFISLTQVAARNVEFLLEYPNTIRHIGSSSEEQSVNRDDVQSVNFSMNTSQYFLETFELSNDVTGEEVMTLTIAYQHVDGTQQQESYEITLDELTVAPANDIIDAFIVRSFAQIVNGSMTCPEFFAIRDAYLSGYDSRIWQTYLPLIQTYYELTEGPGQVD